MSVPLEQMLEELRKAEQARDLMSEVERRLSAGNTDLENLLRQLEQLEERKQIRQEELEERKQIRQEEREERKREREKARGQQESSS